MRFRKKLRQWKLRRKFQRKVLEPGRFTVARPGESPSETMARLHANGPDVYQLPEWYDQPKPRFRRGGHA